MANPASKRGENRLIFEPGGILKLLCHVVTQSGEVVVLESGDIDIVDFCERDFGNGTIIDIDVQNYDVIWVMRLPRYRHDIYLC